uniref:MFS domain-containing protein n=1 Tax=Syphacia muris TaxID=451379 RepID=A0A0N5ACF7_9BILA
MTSIMCIAPSHTGTLSSLSMMASQIANITAPQIVGFFREQGTLKEWRKILLVAVVFNFASAIVFLLFGSADLQKWESSNKMTSVNKIFTLKGQKNVATPGSTTSSYRSPGIEELNID